MKVLYVCADRGIPLLGNKGASVHVRSITAAMQQLGHQVSLAIRRIDSGNPPPQLHRIEKLRKDPDAAAEQLVELIDEEDPDVILERYSLQSGAARSATRRCGLPLTLEVDAPLAREAARYRGLDDPNAQAWECDVLRSADGIHVVSSALLRYARSVAPDVPAVWIPNGAVIERFRTGPCLEPPVPPQRPVVGFVGSMKSWHGVGHLLDAFATVVSSLGEGDPVLVLVGSGPQEPSLRERAGRADLLGRVLFTGQRPQSDVPALVRRFDIAVAPYLPVDEFYFHPLKVVEYLAAGRPVIYADQGDLRALVGSGGLGYQAGNTGQLAERLTAVLASDSLRQRLADAAAERGVGYGWQSIAQRVLRFAVDHQPDQVR